jgi:hypothetical protein
MKFVEKRPFTDPEVAARKLISSRTRSNRFRTAGSTLRRSNQPFLYQLKGTPAEYKAGLDHGIAKGWLVLHESGTYVRFTDAGAALFA